MMCQANSTAGCEDGVAPDGALHLSADEDAEIQIDKLGGNCPVQADGLIDGEPFYFRARWDGWSLSVGSDYEDHTSLGKNGRDVVGRPRWRHEEDWGTGPFDAGWMPEDEARRMIKKGADLFRAANSKSPDEEPQRGDEVDAANKSASLTPQNLEAKAREIVDKFTIDDYVCGENIPASEHDDLIAAILHALREERERAAAEITRLRSDNQKLREALEPFDAMGFFVEEDPDDRVVSMGRWVHGGEVNDEPFEVFYADLQLTVADIRRARAALAATDMLSGLDSVLRTGEEGKSGADVAEEAKGGS